MGENVSINDKWREYWDSLKPDQTAYVIDPTAALPGMELPRHEWKVLNRVRTSHGICRDSFYKWGLTGSPTCDCGEPRQTVHHIVTECPLTAYGGEASDFFEATDTVLNWINSLDFKI